MVSVAGGVGIGLSLQRWATGQTGFDSRQGPATFLYSTASRSIMGTTQPPIQRVPGCLSPGVKRLGSEAGHSPPCSAEVKNVGAIPALPIQLHEVVRF
jgi:hypothetical protein